MSIRKFFGRVTHSVGKGVGVSGIHQYAGIIDHVVDYLNVSRRRNLSVGRWRCSHVNITLCYKSSGQGETIGRGHDMKKHININWKRSKRILALNN